MHNGIVGVRGSTPLGSTKFNSGEPSLFLSNQDQKVVEEMWESGVSLIQVWSDWRRLYLVSDQSVKQSVHLFLSHLQQTHYSHRYRQEFGYVLGRLSLFIDVEVPICQVSTKSWWRSLDAMKAGDAARRKVSVFLNWCLKQGFIKEPVVIHGKPSMPDGEIQVLPNQVVASLIQSCPLDLLGYLWLCLCMGLRVAEAKRTEHISHRDGCLIVGASAAKTRTRRVLDILPGHEKFAELIQPQINLKKRMLALRADSGISDWPRNCMRHTAASHWLNKLRSAESAALHLGNSPVMLHRHYKALVTKKESEEFFTTWDEALSRKFG